MFFGLVVAARPFRKTKNPTAGFVAVGLEIG